MLKKLIASLVRAAVADEIDRVLNAYEKELKQTEHREYLDVFNSGIKIDTVQARKKIVAIARQKLKKHSE